MTRLDEMLQANEAYCKNPPVDYTDEDVHESKLRENPLLPKDLKIHGLMLHPRTGKVDLIESGDA